MIHDTNTLKKEKKETPRRKRWATIKGKHNGDMKGKPKREAVAVRYYILRLNKAYLKQTVP